ncbi:neuronal acetylcholine receptor subunit beta-2-like [Choristoneura fumiferana]|uniref:neuronal acetylcholine receptor subunit beta-2-like n=1 Tax=Choristoneura fumiferana TaxID=7141 RepID=UPI003D15AC4C
MKLFALAFLLSLLNSCCCETCGPKNDNIANLQKRLRLCSESTFPPVNKNETAGIDHVVVVRMSYLLQSFRVDFDEETITFHSWNYFNWQDDRLQWKPEDFKGVKKTILRSYLIWSPGLKLLNNADAGDFDFFYTKCHVNNTGHVRCAVRAEHTVICKSSLKNWPYDTKICDLEFDQWRPGEVKVHFALSHIMYVVDSFQGDGWEILSGAVFKNLTTGIQSTVIIRLRRLSEGLECIIVMPCFVLAIMTTTALLLDYKEDTRFGMLFLSLMSHFAVSNEIDENLPKHTPDTPLVLLFMSSSIVLTIIFFGLSFGFRCLAKKKELAPTWLCTFNDFALTSNFKYLVVTKWDVEARDPNHEKSIHWNNFICIVNSVCFLISVVTYICLFASYIPSKKTVPYDFDIY